MGKCLTYEKSGYLRRALFCLSMVLALCMMFASTALAAGATSTDLAYKSLTTSVQNSMANNVYEMTGGGYLAGADLFTGSATEGYDLQESKFQLLTSSAQSQVVKDIATASNSKVGDDGVTDETVQDWWRTLQQKNGVGSKFLNTILANTKPDFVKANAIYKPFSGPISTVMGVIAVAMMGFLGIVMVSDIAYITLPPIRLFVSDDEKGSTFVKSKIFSHDAIYAVQKAESESDTGSPKQALGIYFKRRIFMLILLGICLLYLVQGQLYTLVGYVLDLTSGFLGF